MCRIECAINNASWLLTTYNESLWEQPGPTYEPQEQTSKQDTHICTSINPSRVGIQPANRWSLSFYTAYAPLHQRTVVVIDPKTDVITNDIYTTESLVLLFKSPFWCATTLVQWWCNGVYALWAAKHRQLRLRFSLGIGCICTTIVVWTSVLVGIPSALRRAR